MKNFYPVGKPSFFLILVIGLSLFSANSNISKAQQKENKLSLDEIWNSSNFTNQTVQGLVSMEDGLHYTALENTSEGSEINMYSYKTGKLIKNIVASKNLSFNNKKINIQSYQFNSNETKLLISTESEQIYRHSTKSFYYIFDLKSKTLQALSDGGKQRLASFSPKFNQIAFIRDNNIFIKSIEDEREIEVTIDGQYNSIINGATDWVYEEEFAFSQAYFWSPDGLKIAYYKFDESQVKEFSMTMYGNLYPEENKFKYPKAGEKNSEVSIHIYNILEASSKPVYIGDDMNQYIPRISWTADENILAIERLNRLQNKIEILTCQTNVKSRSGLDSKVIFTEESTTYIDGSDEKMFFLKDKKHFLWLSEMDGFNHLYLYSIEGKKIKQITSGSWDLSEFLGIDENTGTIFYLSSELSPLEKDLFSIKIDGTSKRKLTNKKGYNKAEFSKGFHYFINSHSDANTPTFTSIHNAEGKLIRTIQDNKTLIQHLDKFNLPKKEFLSIRTADNIELNAWMIKPSSFSEDKKYPVFMFVYGGPGSQTVQNKWEGSNFLFHQYLAQEGYIVVSVDNRGTGSRGRDFKNCTYLQMGKLETTDQIEAAKYLGTLNYVDKNRIGIQGWSYGGYMSSLCITEGADVFKMAIAVAPVTNWRFYDSIYTERYMRTPQENPEGYDKNSPINHVKKLKGKYLLIHGTADDNVHFQNAVEMTSALIEANKQFENAYYPNKNHGIYGGITRLHLYSKITDFIKNNL